MADNVKFDEPEGFVPPENMADDDTFQAMATFKVLPDNQLQLVDIEGYQVGEPEDTSEGSQGGPESDEGTEGAQPLPAAANAGTPGGGGGGMPNQSQDQLAPGANATRVGGFAAQVAQRFRKATGRK